MKPNEFWDCKYSEIQKYCQANLARKNDNLIEAIDLQEAVTNKLIVGNCMNPDAKIILIRDNYKELFDAHEEEQTLEEQRRLFKG